MKLHLPKLLFIAAAGLSVACAADYEVGTHTGGNNLPSKEANYKVYSGDLTLTGTDRMGTFDSSGNLLTDSNFGTEKWSYYWLQPKQDSAGTVTKNVQVTGTLSLNGSAQVSLGGQYKTSTDVANVTSVDEFTGLIVNNLEVNDQAKLNTWNAIANKVTVNSGTVNIHSYRSEGNMGYRVEGAKDSKQVQIREELNVNGGTVTIGHAQYINHTNPDKADTQNPETDYHTLTSFGSYTYEGNPSIVGSYITGVESFEVNSSMINQSAGSLTVAGKSLSIGGLNINQSGGTMVISKNTYHFLADYGDSTIEQSGGTMTLGCLKAFNTYYDNVAESLKENGQTAEINPSVAISQTGAGVMNLSGVKFANQKTGAASTEKSSVTQSGGGVINMGGNYEGATFDITQEGKGGTTNVNGTLAADVVNQTAGSLNVGASGSLSANTVNAGGVEISGNVTLNNGAIRTEGEVVTNSGALNADQITINSGKFVNTGSINGSSAAAMLASTGDAALIMLAGNGESYDVVLNGGEFENRGEFAGSTLVDGGTLTLSSTSVSGDIVVESGAIDIQSGATVGNLTIADDAVVTFDMSQVQAGDSMAVNLTEGSELSISDKANITVTVSQEMLENLGDTEITIFQGVSNADAVGGATIIFTDGDGDTSNDKVGTITAGSTSGSIKVENIQNVPEPTTATLSLLALCGLAMRRRRK